MKKLVSVVFLSLCCFLLCFASTGAAQSGACVVTDIAGLPRDCSLVLVKEQSHETSEAKQTVTKSGTPFS